MISSHLLRIPNFSSCAADLRQEFDRRFADPLVGHSGRFVWDYWHVPDQYTLLRTPAPPFFDQKLYLKFHRELVLWGRRQLGCWDISPPWLSLYIEGCKQELHSDVPHGPWAFVYSLSPQKIQFRGGETLILKSSVLNYWSQMSEARDRELSSFVDRIPQKQNQLLVFDPRYPHGVTEVRGVQDPRQGRLVLHGWFTEPKTYVEGPLPAKKTEATLNKAFDLAQNAILQAEHSQGVLSLQLQVAKSGRVKSFRYGTENLKDLQGQKPKALLKKIKLIYEDLEFPSARSETLITVPLIVS